MGLGDDRKLTEVVVIVNRNGDGPPGDRTLFLSVRFERLPWLRELSTSPRRGSARAPARALLGGC